MLSKTQEAIGGIVETISAILIKLYIFGFSGLPMNEMPSAANMLNVMPRMFIIENRVFNLLSFSPI